VKVLFKVGRTISLKIRNPPKLSYLHNALLTSIVEPFVKKLRPDLVDVELFAGHLLYVQDFNDPVVEGEVVAGLEVMPELKANRNEKWEWQQYLLHKFIFGKRIF